MKLKVAHICRQFLNPTNSFIRNQIENHIDFLPAIIFTEYISENTYSAKMAREYNSLDLEYGSLKKTSYRYKFFKMINRKDRIKIVDFLANNNISVLHFHFGSDAGIFLKHLKRLNIPKFVSFYGYDSSSFPQKYFNLGKLYLKRNTFKYADVILAMSEDMKNDLIKIGCPEEKIIIHYFGSRLDEFSNINRIYSETKNINLLILATLTPKKGHKDLFIALSKLKEKGIKNFSLKIVGTGSLEGELKMLAKSLSIDDQVSFVGNVPYLSDQMLEEIRISDIFIHPSVHDNLGNKEGIPTIITEAMASGLPVISTYHAGIPSIIEHEKTGLLVQEHDYENLARQIERLMTNLSLRKELGQSAKTFALNNLDLKRKEIELEEIYKATIKVKASF